MGKKIKKGTIYLHSHLKKQAEKHPLCQPTPRNFRLGNHIRPRIIKSRFIRWPRYVQIQRKKRILLRRLKVPPAIAQFFRPLDQPTTKQLYEILRKYRPESKKAKKERIRKTAQEQVKEKKEKDKKVKKEVKKTGSAPVCLKYGLKHVTYLIEQKKAKLVLIANDVDPIELVVFLPTLCRSMDIPYAIVQNKAKLGRLVRKKAAAVACLTDFKDNQNDLQNIQKICRDQFNNAKLEPKRPEKGYKSIVRERKLEALRALDNEKK